MKFSLTISVLIIFTFFSCSKDDDEATTTDQSGVRTYTNFAKDVFDTKCVSCHSSGGSPATLPYLSTYLEVKQQASTGRIKARVIDEIPTVMPTSGSLSQSTKDQMQMWLDQGAPE